MGDGEELQRKLAARALVRSLLDEVRVLQEPLIEINGKIDNLDYGYYTPDLVDVLEEQAKILRGVLVQLCKVEERMPGR